MVPTGCWVFAHGRGRQIGRGSRLSSGGIAGGNLDMIIMTCHRSVDFQAALESIKQIM